MAKRKPSKGGIDMSVFLKAAEDTDSQLNELWEKYAPLRERKAGDPMTPAHRDALVEVIRTLHINQGAACALVGLNSKTVIRHTVGEQPEYPEWSQALAAAKDLAVIYWTKMMILYAADKNSPGQRTAEFMMRALLPEVYREDRGQAAVAGTKVEIYLGEGPEGVAKVEVVTVTEGETPAPLAGLLGGGGDNA